MPARINNPRAADQIRREYDVMGDRLNMAVDDVVVPVAVVADLTAGSSGVPVVKRAYSAFFQGNVAAEYGVWRFEVPPGVIAIVRRIQIQSAAGQGRAHFGASFAVVPTNISVATQFIDGRLRGDELRTPSCVIAYDTQIPVLAPPYMYMIHAAAPGFEHIVEWPVGRKEVYDFIEFQTPVVNQGVYVAMEWDEITVG